MNIARTLERSAFHHPERTALIFKDQRWTYRQLDCAASSLASGLAGLGLTPGERIGLHLPNWPEFVLTYFAASKIGLVPISLNVVYRPDELGYIINDGAAAAVVTAEPVAASLPPRRDLPSVRSMIRVGGA
ncbi:MAG: AMP-binding protein, partial [Candidatus Rokubacteria bacterium]|nr:AMP-binding protein [Candidatus Rokubacteria bacterium]